jgi:hypothetical protein
MNLESWASLADDPDPCSDLGYEMEELKVIEAAANAKYIFLPEDESHLADEEFIIIDTDSLRDLVP